MKNNVPPSMKKLRRSILHIVTLLGILSFTVVSTAQAAHIVSFTDPVGDQTGTIDVTGMVMTFRHDDGHFKIDLTADKDHPFFGEFRVDINLFNSDALKPSHSFFSAVCKNCAVFDPNTNDSDFNLLVPTTTLTLKTGHRNALKHWHVGDRVAISSFAGLGNPPGSSLFRSAVAGLPSTFLTNEDTIGYNNITADGVTDGVAIISHP